jgi:selenide, water dikinase
VIATAIKKGVAQPDWIVAATKSMTTLNQQAANVAIRGNFQVHSATDITGFGLIGHAREMAAGSEVSIRLFAAKVPLIPGALECVRQGLIPGGLNNNRDFAECLVSYEDDVPAEIKTMLYDPQTAGGLLLSVTGSDVPGLITALLNAGVPAVEIGEVLPAGKPLIRIV